MKKVILIMISFLFILSCGSKPKENELPKLDVIDFNNNKVTLNEKLDANKKTLILVAAEWCGSCRSEAPEIQRYYDENKDKANVMVIYSKAQTDFEKTKAYIVDNGYTYPAYFDDSGKVLSSLKIEEFPYNQVVKGSEMLEVTKGELSYDNIVNILKD